MRFKTIENSDYSNRLIANLPTRPNASPGNFGGGGLTAVQMKQAYDAMPLFIIGRLNALIEYINGTGDERLSDAILASLKNVIADNIPTGISEEIKTLTGLFNSIKSGELAKVLFVPSGQKPLDEMIGVLNEYEAKFNDYDSKYSNFESVSTSLLGFEPRLSRVEKQVENFYKGGALPVIIDDAVAYSKVVPDGALPYAEVAKVGGMSYKSENYFDKSKVTNATETETGFSFTNTGVAGAPFEIGILKTIAPHLKAGDSVVFYTACVNGWQEYGHLYLNGSQRDWRSGSFITIEQADLDTSVFAYGAQGVVCEYKYFRIVKNEHAPYSPYFEGLRHVKPTAVKSVGANFCKSISPYNNTTVTNGVVKQIEADSASYVSAKVVTYANGVLEVNTPTPVLETKRAFITFEKTNATELYFGVNGSRIDTTVVMDISHLPKGTYTISADFTSITQGSISFRDIMLNPGSSARPYRPYMESSLPIPAAVQSLPDYGLGVSATVNNHVDWSERKYHHPCSEVDLGTLNWGESANGVWYTEGLVGIAMPNVGVCDNYTVIPTTAAELAADKTIQIRGDIAYIKDSSITYASQITGTLVYELAEPEVIDISDILPEDNFIPVEAGGQIVVENEHGLAAPTEIIYQLTD